MKAIEGWLENKEGYVYLFAVDERFLDIVSCSVNF